MTLDDVRSCLGRDIPILVVYQAWGENKSYKDVWNIGHYSVIIGMFGNKITFEDPSLIDRGYIEKRKF